MTVNQRDKSKVFLAYSNKDADWASRLYGALRASGVDAWFDRAEIRPGDEWQGALDEALRNSGTMVYILTPNSVADPWTLFELGAAIAGEKRIIPVVAEEFDRRATPPFIGRYQFLEAGSPEEAARRLAETVAEAA
jgi:hypothetical protein